MTSSTVGATPDPSEVAATKSAGPSAPEEAGPPVCKVCGDPITRDYVLCAACRTPHHRDCWEFVGSCSIYGCNGKQSVPA